MIGIFDGIRDLTLLSVMVRMLFACLCGAVIGLERSTKNRAAGFRTHILVCLGASVAALTGLYLYLELLLPADISRLSGQIITGLGFIGAGTIIVTKTMTIKGLTTAAGLWTTGVIGLAIGSGFYEGGIIGTILVLVAEIYFAKVGSRIRLTPRYVVELLYNEKNALDHVLRFCKDHRMSIINLQIRSLDGDSEAKYAAEVTLRGGMTCGELTERIHAMPGIVSVVGM